MNGEKYHDLLHSDHDHICRAVWWLFSLLIKDNNVQRHGIVFVMDLTRWSLNFSDLGKAAALERRFMELLQGTFPLRLGAAFVFNEGWLFHSLLGLVRMFMVYTLLILE